MQFILEKLKKYNIKFECVTDSTVKVYGNFKGFAVVESTENGISLDGQIITKEEFEYWLYLIKVWD